MKRIGAVLVVLAVACGKRGDPRPPVPIIPQATSDLAVNQRADRIVLSWSYPSLTTSGRSLPAVRRVVVYRYVEELPAAVAATPAAPPEPSVADAVARFAKVPQLPAAQFVRISTRIDSIESANLGAATSGARLLFEDMPPFRSASGMPVRLTYAVVTEGLAARGEPSNLVSIIPLDVAVAPPVLTANASADGVTLTWEAPKAAATGAKATPVITGYNVYRDAGEELTKPANASPATGTTFTDVPPYGEHTYRVTAVASAGPPRIESEPSPVATVTFKDLQPPPVPSGLVALMETTQVRLTWNAVDAPDIAGYHIYRIEGIGMEQLRDLGGFRMTGAPLAETHFVDPTVNKGISYRYEVTAVDKSGNESKPAKTGWVLVPKTP